MTLCPDLLLRFEAELNTIRRTWAGAETSIFCTSVRLLLRSSFYQQLLARARVTLPAMSDFEDDRPRRNRKRKRAAGPSYNYHDDDELEEDGGGDFYGNDGGPKTAKPNRRSFVFPFPPTRRPFPLKDFYDSLTRTAAALTFTEADQTIEPTMLADIERDLDAAVADIAADPVFAPWNTVNDRHAHKALEAVLNNCRGGMPLEEAQLWNKGFTILAEQAGQEPPEPFVYDLGITGRSSLAALARQRGVTRNGTRRGGGGRPGSQPKAPARPHAGQEEAPRRQENDGDSQTPVLAQPQPQRIMISRGGRAPVALNAPEPAPPQQELDQGHDANGTVAGSSAPDLAAIDTSPQRIATPALSDASGPSAKYSESATPATSGTPGTPASGEILVKHKVRRALLERTGSGYKRKVGRPRTTQLMKAQQEGIAVEALTEREPIPTEDEIDQNMIDANLVKYFGLERAQAYQKELDLDRDSLLAKAKEQQETINAIREKQYIKPKQSRPIPKHYFYYTVPGILEKLPLAQQVFDLCSSSFNGEGFAVLHPEYRRYFNRKMALARDTHSFNYAPAPPPLPSNGRWDTFDDPNSMVASVAAGADPMAPPFPPLMIQVDIMNPERPQRPMVSYQVADTVFLTDVVDALPCYTELLRLKPVTIVPRDDGKLDLQVHEEEDGEEGERRERNKAINGSFLFIDGTFYVDDRVANWQEYCLWVLSCETRFSSLLSPMLTCFSFPSFRPVVQWVDRNLPRDSNVRPIKIAKMSTSTFGSLNLRLNHPYIFIHGANCSCQHRVVFSQLHLGPPVFSLPTQAQKQQQANPQPDNYPALYPTYIALNYGISRRSLIMGCVACGKGNARYVTESDPMSDLLPSAWCAPCFDALHSHLDERMLPEIKVSEISFKKIEGHGLDKVRKGLTSQFALGNATSGSEFTPGLFGAPGFTTPADFDAGFVNMGGDELGLDMGQGFDGDMGAQGDGMFDDGQGMMLPSSFAPLEDLLSEIMGGSSPASGMLGSPFGDGGDDGGEATLEEILRQ